MNGFQIRKGRDTKTRLNLSENEKEDLRNFCNEVLMKPFLKSYENKRVRTERFINQPPYLKVGMEGKILYIENIFPERKYTKKQMIFDKKAVEKAFLKKDSFEKFFNNICNVMDIKE